VAPNEQARADWNGVSGQAWGADADRRDRILRPALDALLDAAALTSGQRVLDVGCGCGATSIAAAAAVGDSGSVLGVDLSEPMLAVARRRASDAGLDAVRFTAGDAQADALPGGHDVAISRFGTMFFDDPGQAFANITSALVAGGRLCIVTWQPLPDNPWLVVPGAALRPFAAAPAVDAAGPGMFAQSSPSTITGVLAAAGCERIDVRPVTVALTLGTDAADAVEYVADVRMHRAMLESLGPAERQAALAALTDVLAEHEGPAGVTLDAGILVTTASR
jgi:SAM-dependent methyltransferase